MAHDFIAGIDIGGTKIAVAVAAASGEIFARYSVVTDAAIPPETVMGGLLEKLERMAEANEGRLVAIGIGCPGPLDRERGLVLAPPNMPRSWWQFPLRAYVEERTGLTVVVENDANAAALGEHLYGAGRGHKDLVYLTISTGIGGGIIADHRLVHRVGEAGHVTVRPEGARCGCGARGCLEAECSGTSIARRAQEYLLAGGASSLHSVHPVTARAVIESVREGDELACAVWRETIELLAIGISSIIAVLAPESVILGGGVSAGAGELLFGPLRQELKERVRIVPLNSVEIVPAALGTESGLYGALALVSQRAGKD